MINIIFTIILFNVLLVIFKLFKRYKINNLQALTINYLTMSICCYLLQNKRNIFIDLFHQEWILYAVLIGSLFILTFYLFAYSSQNIGVAVTTIANKMSVIIPVAFALILYPTDDFNITKIIGYILAITGLYLCVFTKEIYVKKKYMWIIIGVFVGQGLLDVMFNHIVQTLLIGLDYYYFAILFLIAFIVGVIILLFQIKYSPIKIRFKNIYWGILFGIINLFTMIFFVKALNIINSAIVYSTVSIGIVISSSLLGVFIFKEKLNVYNWLGIIIASISIYLLI